MNRTGMKWKIVEGFGLTHLVLPGTLRTTCNYRMTNNSGVAKINNIKAGVTCSECLDFARSMNIPTAQ